MEGLRLLDEAQSDARARSGEEEDDVLLDS